MSIEKIADKVQFAVKAGDALGKSDQEIRDDVRAIVGHLPVGGLDAVHAHIADSVARDNAYTNGTYEG
jgi:hypothetical protein